MNNNNKKSWRTYSIGFGITIILYSKQYAGEVEMDENDFESQYADELDALEDFERTKHHIVLL